MKADYFFKNNANTIMSSSQTITTLSQDSARKLINSNSNKGQNTDQAFNIRYDRHKDNIKFYAASSIEISSNHRKCSSGTTSYGANNELQSKNVSIDTSNTNSKYFSMQLGLTR